MIRKVKKRSESDPELVKTAPAGSTCQHFKQAGGDRSVRRDVADHAADGLPVRRVADAVAKIRRMADEAWRSGDGTVL
jgi:uncharacterized NAD(P)/FAD-binding protein YdhS